jgi:hypothetical protein
VAKFPKNGRRRDEHEAIKTHYAYLPTIRVSVFDAAIVRPRQQIGLLR